MRSVKSWLFNASPQTEHMVLFGKAVGCSPAVAFFFAGMAATAHLSEDPMRRAAREVK